MISVSSVDNVVWLECSVYGVGFEILCILMYGGTIYLVHKWDFMHIIRVYVDHKDILVGRQLMASINHVTL